MNKTLRLSTLILGLVSGLWSCGENDDDTSITGPDLESGPGRFYLVEQVAFPSIDGVEVRGLFGKVRDSDEALPVVILVHDATRDNREWFLSPFFTGVLEPGYLPLAIDLRGHGRTPLPDDRQAVVIEDLESMYLDVHAAVLWLKDQPAADMARVAVVGAGIGANAAYVSMGAFPGQIKTAVALSPGVFDATSQPLMVGEGLGSFEPHSVLFMVGDQDLLSVTGGTLSFAAFAAFLAESTGEPKNLIVYEDSDAHGISLLADPQARESLFAWLENHL